MDNSIARENVEKTFRELAAADQPHARSRMSNTPNGYIHLIAWSNASLLRIFVVGFTDSLHKSQYRRKNQIDDAARSTVANIEEGFARPTTKEYLNFLGFSQASLIEVKGDIQRLRQDSILPSRPGSSLGSMKIDLGDWHKALKASVISRPSTAPGSSKILQTPLNPLKGFYRNLEEFKKQNQNFKASDPIVQTPLKSYKFLYDPVDILNVQDLTYEIFIELINKTDWHLRRLVQSLEDKLNRERKFYQVEQARIRRNLRMK